MTAGKWQHCICLKCFRKRQPHGKYESFRHPNAQLRDWEICCFCLGKHKDGLHLKMNPRSRELKCLGQQRDRVAL